MHSLTDKEREDYFPIHIDLGKKESAMGMPMAIPSEKSGGKKPKSQTYFPSVYIDAMPGLEQLPKEGCMLVEFRRKRLTIEENGAGEDTAGVTLELRRICLADDSAEDAAQDLDAALSQYGKNTAKKSDDADDEEY